jgi:hypothetical protein
VIGPWRRGEPAAVPADRVLTRTVDSAMSTAFAKVGERHLSVDLANSIPETGFDLEKLDLGPIRVVARTATGDVTLGTLEPGDYDRAAYEAASGTVRLPLDATQSQAARDGLLAVRDSTDRELLTEQRLTVFADRPNVYLEQGETATVELRVLEAGGPPSAPVSISVVEPTSPLPPVVLQTDADGAATLELDATRAGSWTYILLPWRGQAPARPARLNPELMEYVTLRVTPDDAAIAGLAPTWENVYAQVFRDFEALAPCMDNWLRLGDEQQARAYAPLIRTLTSRERFDDYRYMPVTRELSRGQRTLLHNWCDEVTAPASTGADRLQAADVPPPSKDPFGRGF